MRPDLSVADILRAVTSNSYATFISYTVASFWNRSFALACANRRTEINYLGVAWTRPAPERERNATYERINSYFASSVKETRTVLARLMYLCKT